MHSWRYIHSTDQPNCDKNMKSKYHADRERKYQAGEESKSLNNPKKFDKAGQLLPAGRPAAKKPNPSTTEDREKKPKETEAGDKKPKEKQTQRS